MLDSIPPLLAATLHSIARQIAPYKLLEPLRQRLLRLANATAQKESVRDVAQIPTASEPFRQKVPPSPVPSHQILVIEERKIEKSLIKKLSYSYVKKQMTVPLEESDTEVIVASTSPSRNELFEELRFLFKKSIRVIEVSPETILKIIHNNYQHNEAIPSEFLEANSSSLSKEKSEITLDSYDLLEDSHELSPAIKLLNFITSEAIQHNASDIHFDPDESGLHIRYRIDGVLQTRMISPQELESPLITRLKVMARMDIAQRRLPQDGRIKMQLGMKSIDFRMSTLPINTGERVVLRLLDKGNIVLGLDQIGMPKDILEEFRKGIASSEGLILVTGPTGSGKTTTLYSALSELQSDEVNIMTIEDPVEYRLSGIAQMGIHSKIGLNFSTGLRHILRQDPDIIMIGEIRDKETAEIAIQSALTGHLVLSTLHTNDAPSAITRLAEMGVEPYLISSCCISTLAQRLVRRICASCEADSFRKQSCDLCLGSGFSGRHAIYELMPLSAAIKKQIVISPDATKLKEMAKKEGMKTLLDHGQSLIQDKITTEEEVWRVTRTSDSELSDE
ncbi:MAG: GspE/PulE family protein [Chlamydia sp.]